MAEQIPINPALLVWARQRAGLSREEVAQNFKRIADWEAGASGSPAPAGPTLDEWRKQVMSVAVAGGGVKGGRVIGSSDRNGAIPQDNPKIVQDMLATIYRHLGVDDATTFIKDFNGRPTPIVDRGKAIPELAG